MELVLPTWVVTVLPLIVLVVTCLCKRVPLFERIGPRNIGAIVSIVLAAVIVVQNPPVIAGESWFEVAAAFVGVVMWGWKMAQAIYDLLTGQLATSDGAYLQDRF